MKTNVIEYLNDIAEKYPEKIAYEELERKITFNEVKNKALNISSNIILSDFGIRNIIAIFLPKSINTILSMFGILYSGNTYMPLDVKSPSERLIKILENVNPIAIITDKEHFEAVNNLNKNSKIFCLEDLLETPKEIKTSYDQLIDTDPMYILNTSGSTGVPKAVILPHRAVIDYLDWFCGHYEVSDKDIIAGQAQFYFDVSVTDIYTPLKTGAKFTLVPENYFAFPIRLLEYLQKMHVTILNFIPVSIINIANMDLLQECKPSEIKKILFIGEVMPVKQLNYWIKHYPEALFSNMYGPTEAAVQCAFYDVNRVFDDDDSLPIGFPCHNTDLLILDDEDKLVSEPNINGELCIRGSSLALGYYNNPKATSEHFVQNPLNKNYPEIIYRTGDIACYNEYHELLYKGRKDYQIKHLGHRIELSEIDTIFSAYKDFSCVSTIYNKDKKEIVLLYESNNEIAMKDIIIFAKEKLPKYMIPAKYIRKDKFPRNQNGKIDRKALMKELEKL